MAYSGSALALLAGVAGLIGQLLFYSPGYPLEYYVGPIAYLIPIMLAVAALRRIDRLVIGGLLQGMWWLAVTFAAEDVVSISVDHMFGSTGRFLAADWVLVVSDVLAVTAVILLAVAWSPAVGWRHASRLHPLPVMLLCGVGLGQVAVLIFTYTYPVTNAAFETQGIAGLPVGLAVTWFAVNLRVGAFGGALVLGWSTFRELWLLESMPPWTAVGVVGCLLLAAVMILAVIYLLDQRPLDPSPRPYGEPRI